MLETALSLHAANRPLACAEISDAVEDLCAEGKDRGFQAERLIVELKRIWYSVPESPSRDKAAVISRLVSMCIRQFYGAGPGLSE